MSATPSFIVVGGGIIGCAVANELTRDFPGATVTILEKESQVAYHQTGHNSGVVHAGLYYEPGSLKARLCRRGVALLKAYCTERELAYDECGKLVVALDAAEETRLENIHKRAVANGVPGVRMVDAAGIQAIEPNAIGRCALYSPETAIVDYAAVAKSLAKDVESQHGRLVTNCFVERIVENDGSVTVETAGETYTADYAVVCAGLQSDRVAQNGGGNKQPRIVPFLGQYFLLDEASSRLLDGLVYPVPDPRYPFLGVHLTKRVDGRMTIGPNAFLSLARETYSGFGFNARDSWATLSSGGFWRFASKNIPMAVRESKTMLSPQGFLKEAMKYVPAIEGASLEPMERGIRAQAMDADGTLVDDFRIEQGERVTQVRNAPSPGATSSMAIAEHIVAEMKKTYGLD